MAGLQPVLQLRRVEGAFARLEQLQLALRRVVGVKFLPAGSCWEGAPFVQPPVRQ